MSKKRESLFLFGVFLTWVGVAVLLLWRGDVQRGPRVVSERVGAGVAVEAPSVMVADGDVPRPGANPRKERGNLPASPLDQLGAAGTSVEDDVRVLAMLFSDYQSVFQRMPLGTHQEIVAALRGQNPRGISYIPDGHPAVNGEGKIEDRWGQAYFFHVISRSAMEIISAGPDGLLFSGDDVRYVPPGAAVEPLEVRVVGEGAQ